MNNIIENKINFDLVPNFIEETHKLKAEFNKIVIQHNAQVSNNYGPVTYRIYHDDKSVTLWGAYSKEHLAAILTIEKNMGYILPIKKIVKQEQCELPWAGTGVKSTICGVDCNSAGTR